MLAKVVFECYYLKMTTRAIKRSSSKAAYTKPAPTLAQAQWKKHFVGVLKSSSTRPTSKQIATRMTDIRREMGQAQVRPSLVEKWRSTKSPLTPSDPSVATTLVDALVDLGVFQEKPGSEANEEQSTLLNLLGYKRENTPRQLLQSVFREAQLRLLTEAAKKDKVTKTDAASKMSNADWLTSSACLVSQQAIYNEATRLKASVGGKLVISLLWDARPGAGESKRAISEELLDRTAIAYLRGFAEAGVDTHLVLVVRDRSEDAHGCATDLGELAAKVNPPGTSGDGLITMWHPDEPPDEPSPYDQWIHLYPDNVSLAWKLIRHPDLYKRIRSSGASILCSPVGALERDRLLASLKLIWSQPGTNWRVGLNAKHWLSGKPEHKPNA